MLRSLCCAFAALALASCTQSAEAPLTTASATTTTTTTLPEDPVAAFTECIAGYGVEVPPIEEGPQGAEVLAEVAASASAEALSACAGLLAGSDVLGTESLEVRALIRRQLEAFSVCMRSQGVAEFPDPAEDPGSGEPIYPPDQVPYSAEGFAEASRVCSEKVTTVSTSAGG